MKRVQMGDARVSNSEILKFCKLFSDDITLDNVGRLQLVNLCRLLDIPVVGLHPNLQLPSPDSLP